MKTAKTRIWTRVTDSIYNDSNHYTKRTRQKSLVGFYDTSTFAGYLIWYHTLFIHMK